MPRCHDNVRFNFTDPVNLFENGLKKHLTKKQLAKIHSVKIGIGGAGGLGSNVAMVLVRSGFNKLEILDADTIDPSNLNRQQFFINDVGKNKVTALRKLLRAINPAADISIYKTKWTPALGEKFFIDCDFVIEAFDGIKDKRDFVEFYRTRAGVVVSGVGMAGLQVGKPLTVQKAGNIYFVGDRRTNVSKTNPPMAPRVTACAALMAEVILDLTLQRPRA